VTAEDEPKRLTDWELDQLRFSAEQRDIVDVASKDLLALVGEVAAGRRKASQPYAPLVVLPVIAGVAAWLWTGDGRWAVAGVLLLAAGVVVGTTMDSAHRARSHR
jgi:hypothetical protein